MAKADGKFEGYTNRRQYEAALRERERIEKRAQAVVDALFNAGIISHKMAALDVAKGALANV